jgi:SAM-dependent methyltransferase
MMQEGLDRQQQSQEAEYEYPYHYIPTWENGRFSQTQYWSWGFSYLGGLQVVSDQLDKLQFNSLVDIGCGDGRFLREVAKRYPKIELLGVDYSERAIQLAKALNPNLNYRVANITEEPLADLFDIATLVEVLEHIPPDQVAAFLEAVATALGDGGMLILTVPHVNVPVSDKHYQHFSSELLHGLLELHFREVVFIPFDRASRVVYVLWRLIGGAGGDFVVTNPRLTSWFYRLYQDRYLYTDVERKCARIAAVCRKKKVKPTSW